MRLRIINKYPQLMGLGFICERCYPSLTDLDTKYALNLFILNFNIRLEVGNRRRKKRNAKLQRG